MKHIIIILFFPLFILSQEIAVEQLPDNINTNGAEINFFQISDTVAFFTVITDEKGVLESSIYTSILRNNEWGQKKYSKYNSELFNLANISFSKKGKVFFSICDKEMTNCKIVYIDKENSRGYNEIPAIHNNNLSTQAHITRHNTQEVLYFISDRIDGFGGLDIWLSTIDKNGNFGTPINAGKNINSEADEITPFFNQNDGRMYFSSNRKDGVGDFDIYSSEGKLNFWNSPINVSELNTEKDEMYLTFYDENRGYLASNREGAKFENLEYCCNDIFSFNYLTTKEEISNLLSNLHSYLPLKLYFHNDEPDCCTMNVTTKNTYKDAYISYFKMKDEYEKQNTNASDFFEMELKENFNKLNIILEMLLLDLNNKNKIELQIRGYASPLHNAEYNRNLSLRRISSFINYLKKYKNGMFSKFIQSQFLTITELPFGESASLENVSDNPNDKKNSIYSIGAMKERKIEIVDVILKN